MIGEWREKAQRSVWPSAVAMGAVPREDASQMPFAEDQDAVGEPGPDGPHEAFGVAVRSRASRWDLDGVDAGAGEDDVEGDGELAGSVANEEPEGGDTVVEVVAGVIRRWTRSCVGRCRTRAANGARSAQSRRGLGLVLRRTATSWRRPSSSMFSDADARLNRVNESRSRLKIR